MLKLLSVRLNLEQIQRLLLIPSSSDPFVTFIFSDLSHTSKAAFGLNNAGMIPRQSGCDERDKQDEMPRLDLGMIVGISDLCRASLTLKLCLIDTERH